MIKSFQDDYGVQVLHAWGMTGEARSARSATFKSKHAKASKDARDALQCKQGRAIYGVDMRIVGEDGTELPWDWQGFATCRCAGPGHRQLLQGRGRRSAEDGRARREVVPDRRRGDHRPGRHPADHRPLEGRDQVGRRVDQLVASSASRWRIRHREAAVIGIKHPKWDERPIVVAVKKPGQEVSKEELLKFYEGKIAKWWMPDDVVFVTELPHTATGKLSKLTLRQKSPNTACPRT